MNTTLPASEAPLDGRVYLITGAGQGLGHATALALGDRGATLVLLGKTTAKLEKTYDALLARGAPMPALFPMDLDAAADRDYELLAQALATQIGRLDGIVHCAARCEPPSPLNLQTVAAWQEQIQVNCIAPAAINRACERLLAAAPDGAVVLIGESHGHDPSAYWGGFAVSKAALEAYFKIQAEEWAAPGTPRVNLVIPGPMASPQRAYTHPGEDRETLPSPDSLAQALADLLSPPGRDIRGRLMLWSPGQALA